MYKTHPVQAMLHDEAFAAYEKKRAELGLSKNQMTKLCILQALGLIEFEVAVEDIPAMLRGK